MQEYKNVQELREKYIRLLDEAEFPSIKAAEIAEQLFALDLTVYSKNFSFDSIDKIKNLGGLFGATLSYIFIYKYFGLISSLIILFL